MGIDIKKASPSTNPTVEEELEWPSCETVIGTSAGLDGSNWSLAIYESTAANHLAPHIKKLSANSCTNNPFFEPVFLSPAMEALSNNQVNFLCLMETVGSQTELKFFAPVAFQKSGPRRHSVIRIWSHSFAPLSLPLINAYENERTLTAFVNCIENSTLKNVDAILFENLPKDSVFSSILHEEPRLSDRLLRFSPSTRAAIIGSDRLNNAVKQVSGKRKQRLRKATELLQRFGKLRFEHCDLPASTADMLEKHLVLEDKCWKGRKGTSILKDETITRFVRESVTGKIGAGTCTIHAMLLNNDLLSSMIMFHQNGYYYPWKIAFDEDYAKYSVGNLLLAEVNAKLANDSDFVLLDSLANELNETAGRFWPERLELTSMVIGLGKTPTKSAMQIASELQFLNSAKRRLKKLLGRSL